MAKVLQAKVKSVLSGDTLILSSPQDPRNERTLSFAFVNAPRVRREGDEPYGWASRQYLVENLVGKMIQFRVLYTIPTGAQRDYGTARLQDGRQFPHESVNNGWLKVREDAGRKSEDDVSQQIIDELQLAEARAKADNKGLWSDKSSGDIEVSYNLDDPQKFVDENKGKTLKGQVEKVITGDRVILRFLLSPKHHVQTIALLAGVRAPATKRTTDDKNVPAEPFGEEAALYLTERILLRTLNIEVVGVSPNGQVIARMIHPAGGDMSENLLKSGLAHCTDHHSTMLGSHMAKLRSAEKQAKGNQLNLFQGHIPKASGGESEVTVSRVFSADTIFVRTSRKGPEHRIALSSVRSPKSSDLKQAPWQETAKEFMRQKLIGKHVKLAIDGKKPAADGYEEREVATVTLGGKNVALQLVEAGYASVIRHRRDDPDRSPVYDELLQAEQAATEGKKGIWSDKAPAAKQYQDYSESVQKAKIQASVLQRQKRIPAIVDFVKGPSRFTVLIPRENAKITLVLSCIRAPRSARNADDKGEPFGAEAHEFAGRHLQQRDVEIDIEGTDKVGGFIGTLWINRENFTKLLLEEGLASVHAYSAEKDANGADYFAAEKKAQDERRNIWKDYVPEEEDLSSSAPAASTTGANGSTTLTERRKDYREIMITNISPEDLRLKVQIIGTGTGALEDLMNRFRQFHLGNAAGIKDAPKAGEIVSAKFSADGSWYRAKIRRNDRDAKVSEVVYIDYGNEERIPWNSGRLRPLADQFSTTTLKPQAQDAQFAFIQFPVNKEYLGDAVAFLYEEVAEKPMVANVEHIEKDGTLHVTIFHKDLSRSSSDDKSVNADLIAEGLAFVPRKVRAWERGPAADAVFKQLKAKEEEAKEGRRGVWEYGDIAADD